MARTAQVNTLTLSQMADQKASILIGATFVVFSLSVTKLIGAQLTWAMLSLALTAFVSSVCAVIAVLPATPSKAPEESDANILFFASFALMPEEEWKQRLLNDLESDEAVLRIMLRDVYQNGQVLYRRKYRFLGLAYRLFLSGLLITMAVFAAETVFEIAPVTP
ncbi:MAG: Pycsar system effector family protein [Erythrobacter sp.]